MENKDLNIEISASKKIKRLMVKGQLEEGLQLCEKYENNSTIQSQRVSILITLNRLDEAEQICKKHGDYLPIESQYITILIKKHCLDEAEKVCKKHEENVQIMSQYITILMMKECLDEALELCQQYEDYPPIESQRIKILIKKRYIREAKELCEKHLEYLPIVSQYITILIIENSLSEALKICEKHKDYLPIEIQRIKILTQLNRLDEGLKVCSKYTMNLEVQSKKIDILIKQKNFDEAKRICEKYRNYPPIQIQYELILKELRCNDKQSHEDVKEYRKNSQTEEIVNDELTKLKGQLLTRIYCDKLTLDEIEQQNLDDFDKLILKIAYYEKHNKKTGIMTIKEWKKKEILKYQSKLLNMLYERLSSKKNQIWDFTVYSKYLNCHMDDELFNRFQQEKRDEIKQEKLLADKEINNPKKIIEISKPQTTQPKLQPMPVYIDSKLISNTAKPKTIANKRKKENKQFISKQLLIKDIFEEEVMEIGSYLYVKMQQLETQRTAIKAWDNFEILINKSTSDQKALERMINILESISTNNKAPIDLAHKDYNKYLNK